MIKTAGANVAADGGKWDNVGGLLEGGKGVSHNFGERIRKGTDGMILIVMNNIAKKTRAFTTDKSRWEIRAGWAIAGGIVGFAMWTEIVLVGENVFFTTVA